MSKRGVTTKHTYRKQIYSRYINVSFVLFTISFFLFIYFFTSDRWITNTDPRSFAAAAKKQQTPAPKKKTAKPCSQWCAACGGFCADGENETCNALAASRCGEKPCYAAGPDGKSYLCTQVPVAKPAVEDPVVQKTATTRCEGASSTCSCDPNPVCNTTLRDQYHSSCPEYCEAYAKKPVSTPAVTDTIAAAKSALDILVKKTTQTVAPNGTVTTPITRSEKFGDRCSESAQDCGTGLACLATPYGYYCGEPAKTYKTLKSGEACDSIVSCSNACTGGFYRKPSGEFFCGKPPATTTIAVTTTPQYPAKMGARCTQSKNDCGDGLACITTPYGYYCGVPSTEYQTRKDGSNCGSVLECSNQCEKGFYRNTKGEFYCGKPVVSTSTVKITPKTTITVQHTSTITQPPQTITQRIPSRTPTAQSKSSDVCSNPILPYAAVGELGGDILPNSYAPNDLVNATTALPNIKVEKNSTVISKSAVPMYNCFAKEAMNEGYVLGMYDGGGFRDCAAQKEKNSVECGHSEHQTGLAADLFVIDENGVRHELTVNPNSKGYGDATLGKLLNKADDCGLAHPITYDDPHFFAVAAVVDEKNMAGYTPIARSESNMEQLNAVIRKQQAACEK